MSLPQTAWPREWRFDGVDRVVAIADIHGAYGAMVSTLQSADVLDPELSWTGGTTNLVIVGDILDRGPKSRAAMDLLMRLEGEAESAGGRVHVLIGNHESMILTGDMRYVSAQEYAAFAEDEDRAERKRWFEVYLKQQGAEKGAVRGSSIIPGQLTLLPEFEQNYPPGYFAMRRAFRPDGVYGRWLLEKNIIVVINGTAFVHGGLSPEVTRIGLDGVNQALQKELADFTGVLDVLTDAEILSPTDSHYKYESILNNFMPALSEDPVIMHAVSAGIRLNESEILGVDGPLWYRSNVNCPGIIEEHRLDAALAAIGADRVVVGHTPTPNRKVLQRFGGRLIEIDTGMLNFYYSGIGHALILEGESVSVTSQAGVNSSVPDHPRQVGRRSSGLTTEKLQQLLETGEILTIEKVSPDNRKMPSRTEVKISDGKYTVNAIFHKREAKGIYPGIAAYRMDRLLELDMVPVTVKREIKGSDGSLQFMPDNRMDETSRSLSGQVGSSSSCSITDQWAAMYVFDVLVYNEGRSQQRMLYDKSSWRLMLSEHERTFANKKGRPSHLKKVSLAVNDGWKNVLSEMTNQVLHDNFSDVLDNRRLGALAARRDELLSTRSQSAGRKK